MEYLKITNWNKWQTYRADRGQPPWIKIHRRLMRNPEWVSLSDAEKGRLVAMWLLAADKDGKVPNDAKLIQRLCFLEEPPDLENLQELGFVGGNSFEQDNGLNDGEEDGKIYFIEYEKSIKIGFSKNPWARLNSLKTAMPNEPKLLSHFDGTKTQEKELHKLFQEYRINREWYKPNDYLLNLIKFGLPDVIPASLCGLPDQPEAKAKAEAEADKSKEKTSLSSKKLDYPYQKIISYLNNKTNKNFRHTSKETQRLIKARINQGFTLADFQAVIDRKSEKWRTDPNMVDYLRPQTLFGTKFEGYLNETDAKPSKKILIGREALEYDGK